MTDLCDAHHDGHNCSEPGACGKALLAMLQRVNDRPRLERERDDPNWGEELLAELRNVESQKVRQNLIAYHTAEEITCPHCSAGPGSACITFPRARHATFTHAKRVKARLAQIELQAAQKSVPTQESRP